MASSGSFRPPFPLRADPVARAIEHLRNLVKTSDDESEGPGDPFAYKTAPVRPHPKDRSGGVAVIEPD